MRTKSTVVFHNLTEASRQPLEWGQVIFESWWKRDKAGNIKESTPTTSEFITMFWSPFIPDVEGIQIKMEGLSTGFEIETITDSSGIVTERVVFKPREWVEESAFINALNLNYAKHFKANDR